MKKITKQVIEECAEGLLFELSPNQVKDIEEGFAAILSQMEYLNVPGVDEVEAMTFPFEKHQDQMREDKPEEPLQAASALKNAKNRLGNQIKLPKVVG